METFAWFEQTALSVWVRESPLVFPTLLIAHALGMGIVVGVNVLLAWKMTRRASLEGVAVFAPLVWLGFAVALVSGALLLAAYPAKALTNPVFYSKLVLLAVGLMMFRWLRASSAPRPIHAIALLVVWFAVITGGRLLAYTHSVLLATHLFG